MKLLKGQSLRAPEIKTVSMHTETQVQAMFMAEDEYNISVGIGNNINSSERDVSQAFPELPIQYADYAWWQREWIECEVVEKQIVY